MSTDFEALENQEPPPGPKLRRWPGVVVSMLVPGFGLVRAGRPLRGLAWFAGLQLVAIAFTLLAVGRSVPNWVVGFGMLVAVTGTLAMLVDSFRPGRFTLPLGILFVLVVVTFLLLPSSAEFVARAFKVPTAAMEPTLLGGSQGAPDHVFVDRFCYKFSAPRRGDLVVFSTRGIHGIEGVGESLFVKRLTGLPGEQIEIRDGRVYANGKVLEEKDGIPPITYLAPRAMVSSRSGGSASYAVPADSFFFLGDNAANSFDSRYWGAVPRENIYGRVARIYYPWSRMGVPR
jgi:signal peptidase I